MVTVFEPAFCLRLRMPKRQSGDIQANERYHQVQNKRNFAERGSWMIRVLVVEDQKIMQKYFEYMLSQEPEFKHVQTVADAEEAVGICSYSAIDIVFNGCSDFS